jgi:ubiquitin carboxyl-terminal hydrolase 22/27/51
MVRIRRLRSPQQAFSFIVLTTGPFLRLFTGLRPLLNLSQTCFLSSILQSFIHNPLLRSYFLSDKHNRRLCHLQRKRRRLEEEEEAIDEGVSVGGGSDITSVGECMCCEIDAAFSEVRMIPTF